MTNGRDPAPPRVADRCLYWSEPPPALSARCMSARCTFWLDRIGRGWRANRRIRIMGYDEAAEHFGVYIWEWMHVLRPALDRPEEEAARAAALAVERGQLDEALRLLEGHDGESATRLRTILAALVADLPDDNTMGARWKSPNR